MANQICLKWNSFLNNIATSFESLWEEEGLVDVTLASDGQCLTAHKVILSASSPFFKKVFQTNPCQHPVIILQDVHFTELEALLIFIYKGEVNIEEKKLPDLLKAAETLQIRGLSGNDSFAKDACRKLPELGPPPLEKSTQSVSEETPKRKKRRTDKGNDNSILETALNPRRTRSASVSETSSSEKSPKEVEVEQVPDNAVYDPLEMKMEPFEVVMEDLGKDAAIDHDRLDPESPNEAQGNARDPMEEISGTLSSPSGLAEAKAVLFPYQQLPYADLLPSPEIIGAWATSRPMDHLACDLMKLLFTSEERIMCNVNGKMGKRQFDSNKIRLIREVLLHFSGISPNSVDWEEAWKNCVTKIDTSNRGLKRYLYQRRAVYSQ
ncbi:zinc finger and BTB domain-containing protein 14-like isoform X2 [Fopius arisanus]|uniref:Zinc finger and BTB domain-containing protein 14-like isoform X2 n=1 Tax=Fopius arisanus TaxID=64838 RepID=A0A9R1SXU8_9HYME|nr:PREDICTED: zinc finger and BTB domain-containing protein 14-like isoform X2 [Fopius arisanus]